MLSPTDNETPFPNLSPPGTLNAFTRSHLSPHDAHLSPPRRQQQQQQHGFDGHGVVDQPPRGRHLNGERSRSRRRKRTWKKLMWVKQSYPDNYTDQATFLENLQLNPRLKPYDFWPLVADSTVILQHVCSVIIFVVCFVGIFQERVSPVSVVSWSSVATLAGWILWERWVAEEDWREEAAAAAGVGSSTAGGGNDTMRRRARAASIRRPLPPMGSQTGHLGVVSAPHSAETSAASSTTNLQLPSRERLPPQTLLSVSTASLNGGASSSRSVSRRGSQEGLMYGGDPPIIVEENRAHQRLGTIKSALLIYSTLLGLSPILKSLTLSTSSDSIWAISFWLLTINIFFFDYSGGVGAKFPASLSTNAALMASTVLASRLPSTKQVFSLTLFSIEVFGLFPVFRRHVRHRSWKYHVLVAVLLVLGAGAGVGMVLVEPKANGWPWMAAIIGMVVSVVISALATGGCSWWLIGLQKYKNEIRGPWDPARPIIMNRARWDDS